MNPNYAKRGLILLVLPFLLYISSLAQSTKSVSGTILSDTTWCADTIKVIGDVTVKGTLTICPGTYIEFQGHYKIDTYRILAEGTVNDSIIFTIHDSTGFAIRTIPNGGWRGISILDASSRINYCKFSYGKSIDSTELALICCGSYIDGFGHYKITNSTIKDNYSATNLFGIERISFENTTFVGNDCRCVSFAYLTETLHCNVNYNKGGFTSRIARISDTYFSFNESLSFAAHADYSIIIKNSVFKDNQGLFFGGSGHFPSPALILINNQITNNVDCRISMTGASNSDFMDYYAGNLISDNSFLQGVFVSSRWFKNIPVFINNTISNNRIINDDAMIILDCYYSKSSLFYNNILYGNRNINQQNIQIDCGNDSLSWDMRNNLIEGGLGGIAYNGISGSYEDNLNIDPLFADPDEKDFHLSDYSPCINRGFADTTDLKLLPLDLEGKPRVFDGRIEIGALEYQFDNFHILQQPVSQKVCEGTEVIFETEATGGVIGYQWQKNGVNISSKVNRRLTINDVEKNDQGMYNCLIIADDKTVSTNAVTLTVDENIKILSQTNSFSVCPETDTVLYVTGSEINTNYQWYRNGGIIQGANTSKLHITTSLTQQSDVYLCEVSDYCHTVLSQTIEVLTKSRPNPPVVEDIEVCEYDVIPDLSAIGESIKWYSDQETEDLISVGNSYSTGMHQPGEYHYYITQSILSCASLPTSAKLTIKSKPIISLAESYSACSNVNLTLNAGDGFASYLWSTGATSESILVTQSGILQVAVISENGCSASKSTEIVFYDLPLIDLGEPAYLCLGEELSLNAGTGFNQYQWNTGDVTETIAVSESGVYTVTVKDSKGCSNSDFAVVTVHDLPQIHLPKDTSIAIIDTLIIDAGAGYQSYEWNTGSDNQMLTISSLTPGQYVFSVEVTDQNNCKGKDTIEVEVEIIDNLFDVLNNLDFDVYPNPASGILYFITEYSITEDVVLKLLDGTGKQLLLKKYDGLSDNVSYQINVGNLSAGLYFFHIYSKGMAIIKKVVLE